MRLKRKKELLQKFVKISDEIECRPFFSASRFSSSSALSVSESLFSFFLSLGDLFLAAWRLAGDAAALVVVVVAVGAELVATDGALMLLALVDEDATAADALATDLNVFFPSFMAWYSF